jgi:hypothetical protein
MKSLDIYENAQQVYLDWDFELESFKPFFEYQRQSDLLDDIDTSNFSKRLEFGFALLNN